MKMRAIILIIYLVFISFSGIAKANDSLYISSKEYQVLNQKFFQLDKDKSELAKEIEKVNKRVDDWYINLQIGGSIFIVLLGGLIAIQWNSAIGTARKQAIKELQNMKDEVENTKNKIIEADEKVAEAISKFGLFEKEKI